MSESTNSAVSGVKTKEFTKFNSDVTKGVAICLMIFYHLFGTKEMLEGVIHGPLSDEAFMRLAGFGNICVGIFVLITAYGISKGIFADSEMTLRKAYDKAGKRFGKLMLSFFIFYLSVIIVWFRCFDLKLLYGTGWEGILKMILDATGLSNLFGTPTLNMTWWYLSLAYALIFAVPALSFLVKKTGPAILIAAAFVPYIFLPAGVEYGDFGRYFFVAMTGIVASYTNLPEKVMNSKIPAVLKWLGGIILFAVCVIFRTNPYVYSKLIFVADGFIALIIMIFAGILIGSVPVIKHIFAFLGKHSMNMFFVHTFFYLILWKDFIYGFKYAPVIFLMTVLASLAYSVVLTLGKKFGVKLGKILAGESLRK